MWEWHQGMGWWMVVGSVWFLVFWGLIVWAIVSLTSGRAPAEGRETLAPLELAKRRYARGEISREEFEQLRKDLA